MTTVVQIQRLAHNQDLPLPSYETIGSAGLDLPAAVEEDVLIPAMGRCLVPTGLQMVIPEGFEGQVRPRSGLAYKQGITVLNSPGTIDADYRGEVKVLLVNLGNSPVSITRGMRIAQLVIAPVKQVSIIEVTEISNTSRGTGGFGSTGV